MWTRRRALVSIAITVLVVVTPATATGATTTVTFATVGEHAFVVPAGVRAVQFELTGAPGGSSSTSRGGAGAVVSGSLVVFAGQSLYAEIGGAGANATTISSALHPGGDNGGGAGAAGGGGATDIRTLAVGFSGSLASRLAVAGGGGGSAFRSIVAQGGAGGDAGAAGVDTSGGGGGGLPGSQIAGGAGGQGAFGGTAGGSGTLGSGGTGGGPTWDGGGGGGGYFGGGGGGGMGACNPCNRSGGGGGGSSLVPPVATLTLAAGGTPAQASLSYELADPRVSASGLSFASTPTGSLSASQVVTLTNAASSTQLIVTGVEVDSDDFLIASSTCQGPVDPGATCEVRVRFAPATPGAKAGTLQFLTNSGSPIAVTLTGIASTVLSSPSGAQGPPGPTGRTGPIGPRGPAGDRAPSSRLVHVACRRTRHHGRLCYSRFVGRTPRLTAATTDVTARLTRGGITYASMRRTERAGYLHLTLRARRPVTVGRYDLAVTIGTSRFVRPALALHGTRRH